MDLAIFIVGNILLLLFLVLFWPERGLKYWYD